MQSGNDELCSEIARLKRRLERERATRLHAEAIAEKGLRTLYDRQQQLELLEKIATAANQTISVEDVLQFSVVQICQFTSWEVGHSYLIEETVEGPLLRSMGRWHAADPSCFEEFRRATEDMTFGSGIGLPGRALSTGKPLWISDVTDDGNFPRRPFISKCGFRGASAFPVLSGYDVVAVLEFFTTVAREPDAALLDLMSQIGLQLGRVIERRRAEDRMRIHSVELGRARDEARAADRAKTAFLANMSHELRTPLNAIIGFSELIRDEIRGPIAPQYRDYANDIHQSGLHLKDILNDILDISKAEVGRLELREEPVSVGDTIEACRHIVSGMAEAGDVALSFDIPPELPLLRSERVRLKQIILNLMSNAVKFTPPGGRVRVSVRMENGGVALCVEDTGIGIKPEDIATALEPFRQIDGALNRRYEGTGLGLPLTKALVELHGGHLEIQSVPRQGTRVSVRLPAERVMEAETPRMQAV
jgi:signal transduction histidine kinase